MLLGVEAMVFQSGCARNPTSMDCFVTRTFYVTAATSFHSAHNRRQNHKTGIAAVKVLSPPRSGMGVFRLIKLSSYLLRSCICYMPVGVPSLLGKKDATSIEIQTNSVDDSVSKPNVFIRDEIFCAYFPTPWYKKPKGAFSRQHVRESIWRNQNT